MAHVKRFYIKETIININIQITATIASAVIVTTAIHTNFSNSL